MAGVCEVNDCRLRRNCQDGVSRRRVAAQRKTRRTTIKLYTCLLAASVCLSIAQPAHAETRLRISAPFQLVAVDGSEFGFEADVTICRDRSNRGFGFVTFSDADSAIQLHPIWGAVDRQTGGVVLMFTPVVDRETGPDDIVAAIIQPSPRAPESRLIVDVTWVTGAAVQHDPPPPFEVEGAISVSRRGSACEPVDYGQLDAWVSIDTPAQQVEPLPPSNIIGFDAQILLNRNQAARGSLDVYLPRETVSYEPVFGAAFPGGDAGVIGVVVLLLADRQAPLNTNDHLLRATVAVEAANPDCQIWDLVNGSTGEVNGMFDALGEIVVRFPRR